MTVMIDWVTARVSYQYRGEITGGRFMSIGADGVIDWQKDRWHSVRGSHSSSLVVRDIEHPDKLGLRLDVSGNPSKFLQGHNLFGPDDVNLAVGRMMDKVAGALGLEVTDNDRASWYLGLYVLTRVDVTRSYDVGSPGRVADWLVSASQVAHSRYQPAGNKYTGTLYFGQHSDRVTLKLYDKLAELQKSGHRLPDTLNAEWHHSLMSWASGKLRCEATFRSKWLKDNNLQLGMAWRPGLADRLLDERLEGIEMSDTMKLSDELAGELPRRLLGIYEMWRAGRDLRSLYSREYLSRVRSQLLKYGVDIREVRPHEVVTENQYLLGVPLKSFLVPGGGCPPPDWAVGTELLVA